MAKLLYVEASPRKDRSASIGVAQAFLEAYRERHPNDEIETLDLWSLDLPDMNEHALNAKYAVLHSQDFTPEQKAAWDRVQALCDHFKSGDKYLFSVPMWNFGIPYKLKHYIDVITQPGLTFSYDPETGYSGLVTGRPAVVAYSRGGDYSSEQAAAFDKQKPYLELLLGFLGFTDVRSVVVEPTIGPADLVGPVKEQAQQKARELASVL